MLLVRLIYASTITTGFNETEIQSILQSARENNVKKDITGLLYFSNSYFLQCLEGNRSSVNETFLKISEDKRHHSVVLLDYQEISERSFSEWNMGYVPQTKATSPIILKHSSNKDLNPYSMTSKSAFQLLSGLRDKVPVV